METVSERFPGSLLTSLTLLGLKESVSRSIVVGAAYYVLRYRYSAEEDVAGPSAASSSGSSLGDFFAAADLSGDLSFGKLLRQLRAFTQTQAGPGPQADGNAPLFQVHLRLTNALRPQWKLPAVDLRWPEVREGEADLSLSLAPSAEGLECRVGFSSDLFAAETIQRFIGNLRTLLESAAANPDQAIVDLPLLPEAERRLVVETWNDTRVDYPRNLCLHQIIEQQAEKTPNAPALVFESQTLTYRELNARANQLAHRLRKLGVGPDVLVGVCAERSLEMVIALLASMKAGGAYVPLDPEHPRERLAMVIEDAAPAALLTQQHLLPVLPDHGAPVICLDRDWPTVANEAVENLPCITNGKDQAYAIFTSGSTGKPKGVPNVHEGIVNRLLWMQHAYRLDSTDRILQKTPYSFDVSVWEFFWPLMTGACLVVARPEGHKDASYLVDLIRRQKITTMHFVPSMLRIFLEAANVEQCTSLRRVICSGEALPFDVQQKFFSRLGAELHNLYGPTEAAVDVTYWQCSPSSERNIVPIGKPIWNTQIYILDKKLRPVPVGIPGELHIGGVGLARGYLNRPQLTAEKFVRDPFSQEAGARLYKTGDLSRFLPDGAIEYLGRIDHQVKIRGFRIELGEIEKTLEDHAQVRQSVVMALEDPSGEKRLVAYLLPKEEHHGGGPMPPSARRELLSQLRKLAAAKLPEYMVPSAFVVVDSIPLTSSGKVDRRSLPAPDWSRPEGQSEYVAPQNPIEELVAKVFADVLKLERVGRDDNFFEIGGHSLSAAHALTRLGQMLQVDVPMRVIFEAPTVAALAVAVGGMPRSRQTIEMPPIVVGAKRHGVPLSMAQEALWYEHQVDPNSPTYNVPLLSSLRGELNVEALEKAILAVVERHELLRSAILSPGGTPVLLPLKKWRGNLQQADLRSLDLSSRELEAQRLVTEECAKPFDLARDPLLRCLLIRMSNDEWRFLHNSPHIVFDGGSVTVFYRDLAAFYDGFVSGTTPVLPELRFQFADFAAWQRRALQGEYLASLNEYWTQELSGAPNVDLPLDFPRPAAQQYCGTRRFFTMPSDLLAQANSFFKGLGTTAYRGLYASFNVFLHCYTGLEDICLGTPVAPINPACEGIEDLIGHFVNTLVLRNDISGDPTFREVIRRAEVTVDGAMSHSDLPLNKVVEALRLKRDPSRPLLFQINFRVPNQAFPALKLKDIASEPAQYADTGTSKFDLALEIESTGGKACYFEYRTDLFREETIAQMEADFQNLLRGLIAQPETPLSKMPEVMEISRRVRNRKAALSSV